MGRKVQMSNYEKSLENIIRDALPNVVVTNFVLVAEILNESDTSLFISMNDGMTPWLAQGMLQCGMELISDSNNFGDDEDE